MLWAPSRIALFTASGLVACAALPADLESSADLVVEQERMGVEVPRRPHDAAREVELDVVDAILDLLADGLHPAVGAVDLQCMARGKEVSAGGGEEITAGEQPRADVLPGVEGPLHATSIK